MVQHAHAKLTSTKKARLVLRARSAVQTPPRQAHAIARSQRTQSHVNAKMASTAMERRATNAHVKTAMLTSKQIVPLTVKQAGQHASAMRDTTVMGKLAPFAAARMPMLR